MPFLKEPEMVSPADSIVMITKLKMAMKTMLMPEMGVTNTKKIPGGKSDKSPMTVP